MQLLQTWRWYGPADTISLPHIKQAGAQGIVTALHHIPHGAVWPIQDIQNRLAELKAHGFDWSVVESVPIHEDIKTRTGHYAQYIDNYKESLRNLAACGVKIITYNFMPVNDWTRTDIDYPMTDGSTALYFNWIDLAVFDIYLLQRPQAELSYSTAIATAAEQRFATMDNSAKERLVHTVLYGIHGEARNSVENMRQQLALYDGYTRADLKANLAAFLQAIAPVASELGLQLAIHPDDPPFDILGLPRIVSNLQDLQDIIACTDAPANGLCFCTGSLGARADNDVPAMAAAVASKIHFVHLRNTQRDAAGNFYEADHLAGDTDMYAVMKNILAEQQKRDTPIPFRPDHGHRMLDDLGKDVIPGYSAIGRLRGLAELRGLELGIVRSEGW
jgi:mannonate dehydratase